MKSAHTILTVSVVFAGLGLWSGPVPAEGLDIEPGLWETTSTVTMPMLSQPRVTTSTECLSGDQLSVERISGEDMDPDCRFETGEVHDDTMSWSVECPVEGGTSKGTWTARSDGDTVSGEGNLSVSFQGQSMEMTMSWEGRRIGDCE